MNMIIKLLLFLLIAYPLPFLLGLLLTKSSYTEDKSISYSTISGYILVWGILQITVIPAIYFKVSLSSYTLFFYLTILILAIVSIIKNIHVFKKILIQKIKWIKEKPWLMLIVIFLIIIQTGYLSVSNLGDHDDAFYVATAETALETNTLMEYNPYTGGAYDEFPSRYVLSPFPMYIALMSNLLNIRAATTAHTLLILSLIPLAYMTWYLIGKKFFHNNETKTAVFMLITMCLLIYSGYSVYTQGTFMHIRIWQGKAVLAAIILPFLFYQGLSIILKDMRHPEWIMLFFTMTASCFVSSMGIMLGAIMAGVIAISDLVINKSIKNWIYIILCCVPNILYAFIYILIR